MLPPPQPKPSHSDRMRQRVRELSEYSSANGPSPICNLPPEGNPRMKAAVRLPHRLIMLVLLCSSAACLQLPLWHGPPHCFQRVPRLVRPCRVRGDKLPVGDVCQEAVATVQTSFSSRLVERHTFTAVSDCCHIIHCSLRLLSRLPVRYLLVFSSTGWLVRHATTALRTWGLW